MRHQYTSKVACGIALILVLSALFFAAARSWMGTARENPPEADMGWKAAGLSAYQENCQFCHGDQGQGRNGLAPPVAGWTTRLHQASGGPAYLIQFLLQGLEGEIDVEGVSYPGNHPAFDALSDAELAALLNQMLVGFAAHQELPSGGRLYSPADVAEQRRSPLPPDGEGVHALRMNLVLESLPGS